MYQSPNHLRRATHWKDQRLFQPLVSCIQQFSFSTKHQPSISHESPDKLDTHDDHHQHGYTLSKNQIKAIRLLKSQKKEDIHVSTASSEARTSPLAVMKEHSMQHDLQQEVEKPSPWYNLLMHPSRALWRSSPQLPPKYITDLQSNLIQKSGRKTKQLKRTYEMILKQQKVLIQTRESQRRQLVNGILRGGSDLSSPSSLQDVHPIYYKPEYTLGNLKYRLIPNYSITKRVLAETQSLLGIQEFQPKRILDVGCGIGSASAAVLEYFRDGRGYERGYTIQWIHGIDPSQSMRDSAQYLLQDIIQQSKYHHHQKQEEEEQQQNEPSHMGIKNNRNNNKTRITFSDSLTSSSNATRLASSTKIQSIRENGNEGKGFDLALCVYTLSEIPSVAAVLSMAAIIWEKVAINGVVIFIEPGTPDGFNAIRSVRSMLLDCCPPYDKEQIVEQCHVIAPCTHNGTCPMERHKKDFIDKRDRKKNESFDDWVDDGVEEDDNIWGDRKLEKYGLSNKDSQGSMDAMVEEEEEHDDDDDDDDEDIDEIVDTQDDDDDDDDDDRDPITSSTLETNAFSSAYCSFVHGMPGGTTRTSGEKFSYLVVQKRTSTVDSITTSIPPDPFTEISLVDLLKKSIQEGERQYKLIDKQLGNNMQMDGKWKRLLKEAIELEDTFVQSSEDKLGLELVRGDRNRKRFGRIIRAPLKKRGHVILDYCSVSDVDIDSGSGNEGRIIRHKISRGKSIRLAPGMFAASRKARWGGLWPDIRR